MNSQIIQTPIKFSIKTNNLDQICKKADKQPTKISISNSRTKVSYSNDILCNVNLKHELSKPINDKVSELKLVNGLPIIRKSYNNKDPTLKRSLDENADDLTSKFRKFDESEDTVIIDSETSSKLVIHPLPQCENCISGNISKTEFKFPPNNFGLHEIFKTLEEKISNIDKICKTNANVNIEKTEKPKIEMKNTGSSLTKISLKMEPKKIIGENIAIFSDVCDGEERKKYENKLLNTKLRDVRLKSLHETMQEDKSEKSKLKKKEDEKKKSPKERREQRRKSKEKRENRRYSRGRDKERRYRDHRYYRDNHKREYKNENMNRKDHYKNNEKRTMRVKSIEKCREKTKEERKLTYTTLGEAIKSHKSDYIVKDEYLEPEFVRSELEKSIRPSTAKTLPLKDKSKITENLKKLLSKKSENQITPITSSIQSIDKISDTSVVSLDFSFLPPISHDIIEPSNQQVIDQSLFPPIESESSTSIDSIGLSISSLSFPLPGSPGPSADTTNQDVEPFISPLPSPPNPVILTSFPPPSEPNIFFKPTNISFKISPKKMQPCNIFSQTSNLPQKIQPPLNFEAIITSVDKSKPELTSPEDFCKANEPKLENVNERLMPTFKIPLSIEKKPKKIAPEKKKGNLIESEIKTVETSLEVSDQCSVSSSDSDDLSKKLTTPDIQTINSEINQKEELAAVVNNCQEIILTVLEPQKFNLSSINDANKSDEKSIERKESMENFDFTNKPPKKNFRSRSRSKDKLKKQTEILSSYENKRRHRSRKREWLESTSKERKFSKKNSKPKLSPRKNHSNDSSKRRNNSKDSSKRRYSSKKRKHSTEGQKRRNNSMDYSKRKKHWKDFPKNRNLSKESSKKENLLKQKSRHRQRSKGSSICKRRSKDSSLERKRSKENIIRRKKSKDSLVGRKRSTDSPVARKISKDSLLRRKRSKDSPVRRRRSSNSPLIRRKSINSSIEKKRSVDSPIGKKKSIDCNHPEDISSQINQSTDKSTITEKSEEKLMKILAKTNAIIEKISKNKIITEETFKGNRSKQKPNSTSRESSENSVKSKESVNAKSLIPEPSLCLEMINIIIEEPKYMSRSLKPIEMENLNDTHKKPTSNEIINDDSTDYTVNCKRSNLTNSKRSDTLLTTERNLEPISIDRRNPENETSLSDILSSVLREAIELVKLNQQTTNPPYTDQNSQETCLNKEVSGNDNHQHLNHFVHTNNRTEELSAPPVPLMSLNFPPYQSSFDKTCFINQIGNYNFNDSNNFTSNSQFYPIISTVPPSPYNNNYNNSNYSLTTVFQPIINNAYIPTFDNSWFLPNDFSSFNNPYLVNKEMYTPNVPFSMDLRPATIDFTGWNPQIPKYNSTSHSSYDTLHDNTVHSLPDKIPTSNYDSFNYPTLPYIPSNKKSSTSSLMNEVLDMDLASDSCKSVDSGHAVDFHDHLSDQDNLSSCDEFEFDDVTPLDPFEKFPNAPKPLYEHIMETEVHSSALRKPFEYAYLKSTVCNCVPPNPDEIKVGKTACDENCFNRRIKVECNRKCPVYELCTNRRFQEQIYAPFEPFYCTNDKGWGIRSTNKIYPGTFIIEYVGELIDFLEFLNRINQKSLYNHHFIMAIQKDMYIDAGNKGNWSRFVNHSCDPNTIIERWVVNGKTRIGFFSKKMIMENEEITIDYQFQQYGMIEQKCFCCSANCTGVMGKVNEKLQEQIKTSHLRSRKELIHKITSRSCLRDIKHVSDMITVIKGDCLDRDTFYAFLEVLLRTDSEICFRTFIECGGLKVITSFLDSVPWDDWSLKLLYLQCLDHFQLKKRTILSFGSTAIKVVDYWSDNPRYILKHEETAKEMHDDLVEINGLEFNDVDETTTIAFTLHESEQPLTEVENQMKELALKIKEYFNCEKEKFYIPKLKINHSDSLADLSLHDSESKSNYSASRASSVQGDYVKKKRSRIRRKCKEAIQKLSKDEFRRLFSERYEKSLIEKTPSTPTDNTPSLSNTEPNSPDTFQIVKKLLSDVIIEEINRLKQSDKFSTMPVEFQNLDLDKILSDLNIVGHEGILSFEENKNSSASTYSNSSSKSQDENCKSDVNIHTKKPIRLPPNWNSRRSETGRIYYYNTVTKKTQWEEPVYPWDAGENDLMAYDFGNASNFRVTRQDVLMMHEEYKKNFKLQKIEEKRRHRLERSLQRKLSLTTGERNKIEFSKEVFRAVKTVVKPYNSSSCKIGRVLHKQDLKFLCEKFSDTIIGKEVKSVANLEDLEMNANVRSKIRNYIEKYMANQGRLYKRSSKTKPKPKQPAVKDHLADDFVTGAKHSSDSNAQLQPDVNNSPDFSP